MVDLWHTLAASEKPVVLYGMGNGADKILEACARFGIGVSDVFASDEFVRGQSFHGMRVLRYDEVVQKYGAGRFIVLVSFATAIPAVMERVEQIALECELYVPDVPVRGHTLFCAAYEQQTRALTERACALLADDRSREVFRGVMDFRRTGRLDRLRATENERTAVMQALLHTADYRVAVDVGAYDGDTARELITLCPRMERVFAIEPDRRNFRKLSTYARTEPRVFPISAAAWSERKILLFDDSGNRNAGADEDGNARRQVPVQGDTLDRLIGEQCVDYIKYDVEGSEAQALMGSGAILRRWHPDVLLSLYHRTEDLHALILQLHDMCPEYRLYLRRYPYIPAWDLNLIATVRPVYQLS